MAAVNTVRKVCPLCGGRIKVGYFYQYSLDYTITKSGKLSKRYTKNEGGTMDVKNAYCESCDAYWGDDDFDIIDGQFMDGKYVTEEEQL